jgi:hypothetical protein
MAQGVAFPLQLLAQIIATSDLAKWEYSLLASGFILVVERVKIGNLIVFQLAEYNLNGFALSVFEIVQIIL